MFSLKKIAAPIVVGALAIEGMACATNTPAAPSDQVSGSPTPVSTPATVPTPTATAPAAVKDVPAPIDEVTLVTRESLPPQYSLSIKSGLPSGCAKFKDFQVTRTGETIKVTVTNTLLADPNVMCTMIYGIHESMVPLGSDFKAGVAYTIEVNDKSFTLIDGRLVAKGDENLAPIDEVRVDVEDGKGVLVIVSGIPNACYAFDNHTMEIVDGVRVVKVYNKRTAPADAACAEVYGSHETRIDLGGDIEVCSVYQFNINGQLHDLQAIAPNVRCAPPVTPGQGEQQDRQEVQAPIESVKVVRDADGAYYLQVVAGLPGGCAQYSHFEITRDGAVITVIVKNTEPVGPVACTREYRYNELLIPLGKNFTAGTSYTVNVNGADHKLTSEGSIDPEKAGERKPVLAPIDEVTIAMLKSMPPQFLVNILAGLPSGCAQFGGYMVELDGDRINITVTNYMPSDPNVACTMIYGTKQIGVNLGSNFEQGKTYTVSVNGVEQTFVGGKPADWPETTDGKPGRGSINEPLWIGVGSVIAVDGGNILVEVVKVLSDSRCPANAMCIQQGEAKVLVEITVNGVVSQHELVLTGAIDSKGTLKVGDYVVKLMELNPYPGTWQGAQPEHTATVIVLKPGAEVKPQVTVKPGESVKLTPDGKLQIKFIEVLKDSRCPANVVCVWAGRVRVKVQVTYNGMDRGEYELILEGDNTNANVIIEEFNLQLVSLDPYPGTTTGATTPVAGFSAYRAGGDVVSQHVMTLRAEAVAGKARTYKFTAVIVGGADNDQELYCNGWEWKFGDGKGEAAIPACIVWSPDVKMPREFAMEHTYDRTGTYVVSFTYGRLTAETRVDVR